MLTSMDALEGAVVLDLFAGSGALGIEALSRGAAEVTFVERDPAALRAIRANLEAVGASGAAAHVTPDDALRVAGASGPVDVVLADPPYAFAAWPALLAALAPRTGLLVAETGSPWDPGPAWETVRVKRYGDTVVTIIRPVSRPGAVMHREGEM